MGKKAWQIILLIVQILITIIYGAIIVHMTLILVKDYGTKSIVTIQGYFPQFVILISSLVPQIIIRIRRKMHTQDGEIFPILFTMIALQATLIVPRYVALTEVVFISPRILTYLERFSLIGTASLFLLSSLRFYGFNSPRMSWYIVIVLAFSLFISVIAPVNYTSSSSLEILSGKYDAMIQLSILLFYAATILTLVISAAREKGAVAIKRLIGFIFLIAGLYLGFSSLLIPVILSSTLYIVGIVIISNNVKESF